MKSAGNRNVHARITALLILFLSHTSIPFPQGGTFNHSLYELFFLTFLHALFHLFLANFTTSSTTTIESNHIVRFLYLERDFFFKAPS